MFVVRYGEDEARRRHSSNRRLALNDHFNVFGLSKRCHPFIYTSSSEEVGLAHNDERRASAREPKCKHDTFYVDKRVRSVFACLYMAER